MQGSERTTFWLGAAALAAAALACSLPGMGTPPATSEPPLPEPSAEAATEEPETAATASAPPTTAAPDITCPEAGDGTAAYRDDEKGFCLLYPAEYEVNFTWDLSSNTVAFIGPPLDPASLEPALVVVRVSSNGPAIDVSNAAEYAAMWQDIYVAGEPSVESVETTVGGQAATVLRNVPARLSEQVAFVVANGYKYTVALQPQPEDIAELAEQANEAWATVTESIVFFEPDVVPDVVLAADVCPAAGPDTVLHTSLSGGYCFLVPASAERDTTFESGFELGPVIESTESWGDIRAKLVFGTFGAAGDETPRERLQPFIDAGVDPATVEEVTFGIAPAVTYLDERGPFPMRGAMIIANEQVYTIVNSPYSPTEYAGALADIDLLWTTVTGSIQFFTPWR